MRRLIVLVAGLLAALVPAVALATSDDRELKATLTGRAEVPKGDPNGTGSAEVKIEGRRVCWEIKTRGIARPTAAHIHKAPPGKAGPVVVPFGGAFKAKGCQTATATVARALAARPSAYYVNVHNAPFPAGAVRGQLRMDDD
jgi:hypothetical protein